MNDTVNKDFTITCNVCERRRNAPFCIHCEDFNDKVGIRPTYDGLEGLDTLEVDAPTPTDEVGDVVDFITEGDK